MISPITENKSDSAVQQTGQPNMIEQTKGFTEGHNPYLWLGGTLAGIYGYNKMVDKFEDSSLGTQRFINDHMLQDVSGKNFLESL